MKILAVIPARYASTRFPGKPLADICGKPMIWWVYNQVNKSEKIDDVIVATDDERIKQECEKYDINVMMTSNNHKTSTERVFEVAQKMPEYDYYIVVNGDEPLIDYRNVEKIIPDQMQGDFYVANLKTKIEKPSEVVDFTNIKVVTDTSDNALYFSRSPIPYPKSSLEYDYYKHVGILIYNYAALEFFSNTEKGPIEKIEDVNELRFVEHGKKIKMIEVESESLSVDTPKDLEKVKKLVSEQNYEKN